MKQSLLFAFLISAIIISSITTSLHAQTKICVIADTHYFDPQLLEADGSAFQTYLAYDRKLLQESEAILESLIASIKTVAPDVVLVAGDLTKDGEKSGHQKVAAYFQQLEDAGIEVIVTPGNHDVNNPHAVSFNGDATHPVSSVTPEDFQNIYTNFGYQQASEQHTGSLSYVYPINNDVVVISMDVCRYTNNTTAPETSGGFSSELLSWVISKTEAARAAGKQVLGLMHHGLLEHYTGQKQLMSEYVVDDWENVSNQLAAAGMKVVFTGHYHAQDVVSKSTDNGLIYDVETGSAVTYPCPYRTIQLTAEDKLIIDGNRVQTISYDLGGKDFQTYAKDFIETGLPVLVKGMLMHPPYNLEEATASQFEPAITETFIAHYTGNEGTPSAQTLGVINLLLKDPNYSFMGAALSGMWNDINPDDWSYTIDLANQATAIQSSDLIHSIQVYPNPVTGPLHVDGQLYQADVQLNIYNLSGEIVLTQLLNENANTIHHQLKKGIYLLELTSKEMKIHRKLLVK